MMRHRNCITDPTTKAWWRDYQHVIKDGNPLGLSFVEYIAVRLYAAQPQLVSSTSTTNVEWYMSPCGHSHPWGVSCSEMAVTT